MYVCFIRIVEQRDEEYEKVVDKVNLGLWSMC